MKKERITIGLLVANLEDVFSNQVCRGAVPAAEEIDANLIIFPGRYIDANTVTSKKENYEYQHNTLFNYAKNEHIDILLACLGDSALSLPLERKRKLLEMYEGIPIITIASRVGGYDFVQFDNKTGLKEGINYLIQVQNRRKIGMVCGPRTNEDAQERLEVYKETLTENGIAVDENRIVYGNFTFWSQEQAADLLDRNQDLDAIVFANDHMASAGYQVMRERGIKIGEDIAVLGFDDAEFAVSMRPNLATVRADAVMLGYRAVMEGYKIFKGDKTRNPYVDSQFIMRNSCGVSFNDVGVLEKVFDENLSLPEKTPEIVSSLCGYLFNRHNNDFNRQDIESNMYELVHHFILLLLDVTIEEDKRSTLDQLYDKLLDGNFFEYTEVDKVFHIIDLLYHKLMKSTLHPDKKKQIEDIFVSAYKKLAYNISTQTKNRQSRLEELNNTTNTITRDMLSFANGKDESYAVILEKMGMLNIKSSYLYMFEQPIRYRKDDTWELPQELLLKAYQDGKKVHTQPSELQNIKTQDMFQNPYLPSKRRYTMVLSSLYSSENQYGLFLCEFQAGYYHYVENITYQISAAIKVICLLQTQEAIQKRLQESLLQIQANNIALDTISKSDELTGLLNRRGFMQNAQRVLDNPENEGRHAVIFYADMDNLKIINDTFGHEEGDFALQNISRILKEAFRSMDVVGRIGGDEFAALTIGEQEGADEVIKERVKECSRRINEKSEKPYYTRVTVGSHSFVCNKDADLQKMLDLADVKLYREKMHKDRHVLKKSN